MVLVRLNPTTALSAVKQTAGDLARWVGEAGRLQASRNLPEKAAAIVACCDDEAIEVELFIDPSSTSESVDALGAWLGEVSGGTLRGTVGVTEIPAIADGPTLKLTSSTGDQPRVRQAGLPRSPILIILTGCCDAGGCGGLVRAARDRPLVILVVPEAAPGGLEIEQRLAAVAWQCRRIDPADLASETLRQQLASPGWHPMLPVVRAFMAAAALDALTTVFAQALEAEGRGLMAKRALAHQQAVAQQLKPEVNTNELTHQVRTCLQRQFGELERGVKQRLTREFAPQVGTLWKAIDGEIAGLDELAKEVRARSIATRLRDEYRERLMACLHEKLSQHLIRDLVAMHDLFRVVAHEVETLVKNAAGPLLVPQLNHLTDDRVHALLETNLVLNREYRGELPRPGIFEYFMIARRSQIMIFMLMSAFGLSFIRTHGEIMIPMAILLLAGGGVALAHRVRRERFEAHEKELEKAGDLLRGEVRRILSDVQRAWQAMLSQHLDEQQADLLDQLDRAVREHAARATGVVTENRQLLQRQLQRVESLERRLATAAKGGEQVAKALAQITGELQQIFISHMRSAGGTAP